MGDTNIAREFPTGLTCRDASRHAGFTCAMCCTGRMPMCCSIDLFNVKCKMLQRSKSILKLEKAQKFETLASLDLFNLLYWYLLSMYI